jgi:hypothetical protein
MLGSDSQLKNAKKSTGKESGADGELKSSRTKLTEAISLTQLTKVPSLPQINISETDQTPKPASRESEESVSPVQTIASSQPQETSRSFNNAFCCTLFCIEDRYADFSHEFLKVIPTFMSYASPLLPHIRIAIIAC